MRRRDFTKTTAGVTAWTALSASRVLGANDRIGLFLIGFLIFEPLGLFGIWIRVRNYWKGWPFSY